MRLTHTALTATFPTFFLGLAAALQLIAFCIYLGVQPDWTVATLFCILTAGTYLLNRVVDKEDKFNNILRWRFFNETPDKTAMWMTISILSLIIPSIALIAFKKSDTALQFAVISFISFTYTVKIIPSIKDKKICWVNLKEIPVLKNFVVCTLWSGSVIIIAASISGISVFRYDLLLLFITIFLSTCNNTIASDARDIPGDQLRNIKTVPVLIGVKNTILLLSVISSLGVILTGLLFSFGLINSYLFFFALFIIPWSYLCALSQCVKWISLPKAAVELLMDSDLLLIPVGLFIISSLG